MNILKASRAINPSKINLSAEMLHFYFRGQRSTQPPPQPAPCRGHAWELPPGRGHCGKRHPQPKWGQGVLRESPPRGATPGAVRGAPTGAPWSGGRVPWVPQAVRGRQGLVEERSRGSAPKSASPGGEAAGRGQPALPAAPQRPAGGICAALAGQERRLHLNSAA